MGKVSNHALPPTVNALNRHQSQVESELQQALYEQCACERPHNSFSGGISQPSKALHL
jgi:hypothetical protein